MSIADEARAEAENRWPISDEDIALNPGYTRRARDLRSGWDARGEWQASRKPEAAPSDTDREALIDLIEDHTVYAETGCRIDGEFGVAHQAEVVQAAGFSPTSQPVQVEVTPEVGDAITVQGVIVGLNHPYDWANIRFKNGTVANVPLSAALGGGDHAE